MVKLLLVVSKVPLPSPGSIDNSFNSQIPTKSIEVLFSSSLLQEHKDKKQIESKTITFFMMFYISLHHI
jgi:hypothetical protein